MTLANRERYQVERCMIVLGAWYARFLACKDALNDSFIGYYPVSST